MGLSSTNNRKVYTGDGSSAVFSFPYYFFNQSDLNVYLYDTVLGGVSPQTINTNYTISGTPNSSGIYPNGANVVMNSAIVSTAQIVITRNPPEVQNFSLLQNGLLSSQGLTQQFDYLTLLVQRLEDQVSRAVTLPDGFGPTFSTQLPNTLAFSAGAPIVINSGGTGFTFGLLVGTGSSASTFSGILPVVNGGTGSAVIPVNGQVPYAVSPTQYGYVGGGAGLALVSNGSSAPSYQSLNVSSLTGTLLVTQGGTGTASNYTQFGLLVASSATQFSSLGVGGTDVPLIGNGGALPSFQSLNLASNSSVKNVLATANGGTGTAGPFTQYGLAYAATATSLGTVASAGSSTWLKANGSSAPAFTAFSTMTMTQLTTKGAGTYTPPAGTLWLRVKMCGGGGGAGGCASGSGVSGGGVGGGGAGYLEKLIPFGNIAGSYSYTVGSGGLAGSAGANAGTVGSSSIFGVLTCTGGTGGGAVTGATVFPAFNGTPVAGGSGSNGDLNMVGGFGGMGILLTVSVGQGGVGGANPLGTPNTPIVAQGPGVQGQGFGVGGNGGLTLNNGGTVAGAAGTAGAIFIEEHYQ